MATTYKSLSTNDIVTTKTLLHEAIPITGTIASGSYNDNSTPKVEQNIKNYTHGQFQSVYDYPYLSSSANHIFDLSIGIAPAIGSLTGSALSGTTAGHNEISKKVNMYNQMAQVLMGYDQNGNVQMFDEDGDLSGTGGAKLQEVIFINFARLLTKDEIKKGSFSIELGSTAEHNLNGTAMATARIKISDTGAQNEYRVNSPAGDYGILYAAKSAGSTVLSDSTANSTAGSTTVKAGLLFYQAGVAVIPTTVFKSNHASVTIKASGVPTAGGTINIIAAGGSNATFTAHATSTSGNIFAINDNKNGLTNLKNRIEASNLASLVTVSAVQTVTGGFMITITQNTAGTTGNTTITNALTTYSVAGGANDANGDFSGGGGGGILAPATGITQMDTGLQNIDQLFVSGALSASCDSIRQRLYNLSFNNTTELNSTVYFCRAHHNEFNYSTNPTYLTNSQIHVKTDHHDSPISYITTVGLYSADNELLAVAKLSEPLRKDPTNELTLRVRLDY